MCAARTEDQLLLNSVWAVAVALVPVLVSFHSILGVFVVTDKNYSDSILS